MSPATPPYDLNFRYRLTPALHMAMMNDFHARGDRAPVVSPSDQRRLKPREKGFKRLIRRLSEVGLVFRRAEVLIQHRRSQPVEHQQAVGRIQQPVSDGADQQPRERPLFCFLASLKRHQVLKYFGGLHSQFDPCFVPGFQPEANPESGWADDYETICAQMGAAFTLRFVRDGSTLDVTFGQAVVARLFDRWISQPPREGLRLIPLISPDDHAGLEAADAQFQFGGCAPGYVHVRFTSDGGNIEAGLEGRVGMDIVYPDAACERDAHGRTTLRKDLHPGFAGLRDSQCEYAVYVSGGHDVGPVSCDGGDNAESGLSAKPEPEGRP